MSLDGCKEDIGINLNLINDYSLIKIAYFNLVIILVNHHAL